MEKEFVPYKEALELKEIDFNEPCFAQYRKYDIGEEILDIGFSKNEIITRFNDLNKFCSAPTFSQVFRWFRDKYDFHYTIQHNKKYIGIAYSSVVNFSIDEFDTYEEAELECLRELIKIVKNENR